MPPRRRFPPLGSTTVVKCPSTENGGKRMPTLVQVSDLHLQAGWDSRLANVPTWKTWVAIQQLIEATCPAFDRLILTGDIAHDEIRPTYQALAAQLGEWRSRTRLIPGNHDSPGLLGALFDAPGWTLSFGFGFSEELGDWQLIGLDSHRPGQVGGHLGATQLDWLDRELSRHCERPVALFVHHPPMAVGINWDEPIALADSAALLEVTKAHQNVRFLGSGHVHQAYEEWRGNALFTSSPSSAFQLTWEGKPRISASEHSGLRRIELRESGVLTEVIRLPELVHPPLAAS